MNSNQNVFSFRPCVMKARTIHTTNKTNQRCPRMSKKLTLIGFDLFLSSKVKLNSLRCIDYYSVCVSSYCIYINRVSLETKNQDCLYACTFTIYSCCTCTVNIALCYVSKQIQVAILADDYISVVLRGFC